MSNTAKTEWKCDRCSGVELRLTSYGAPHSWSKYGSLDLCGACTTSLQRWWDDGRCREAPAEADDDE